MIPGAFRKQLQLESNSNDNIKHAESIANVFLNRKNGDASCKKTQAALHPDADGRGVQRPPGRVLLQLKKLNNSVDT